MSAPRRLAPVRQLPLAVLLAALLLAACAAPGTPRPGADRASSPGVPADLPSPTSATTLAATGTPTVSLRVGRPAWVTVSVATLWRTPYSPRPVDRPALARPARIRAWLSAMTLDQRRALNGRADTQALLGERVRVVRLRPGWAKVVVPDQPTPDDTRGYPGWVPTRQLTARPPASAARRATVTARLVWLRTDDPAVAARTEVSFGTTLPYLGTVGSWVRVSTPVGVVRRVRAAAVSVHRPGTPALRATGADLVRAAVMFRGLAYLWAGRSGFGFDCSGLTSLDYAVHGVVIPRDAAPQSRAGRPVGAATLRKGDLMFYASNGVVHHVSMYAGNGLMVHAPRTGSSVQVLPTSTPAYASQYAGARRYLP